MAEFLTTRGISYYLEELIKSATSQLVIISPYLDIPLPIKHLLEEKALQDVTIHIIYRNIKEQEKQWLQSTSIGTSVCEHLHAKCYFNDSLGLLTSMNLYEYSEVNNYEMGVLITRQKDPDLYNDIVGEYEKIASASTPIHQLVPKTVSKVARVDDTPQPSRRQSKQETIGIPSYGLCIRCNTAIPANPVKPYCDGCFRSWNRYKNPDYEENEGHCHICGDGHTASMNKPLCRSCYRKYKDVFEFAGV